MTKQDSVRLKLRQTSHAAFAASSFSSWLMEIEALISGVQPPEPQPNGYSFTEDIKQSVNKVKSKVDRKRNEKK